MPSTRHRRPPPHHGTTGAYHLISETFCKSFGSVVVAALSSTVFLIVKVIATDVVDVDCLLVVVVRWCRQIFSFLSSD